MLKTIVLGLTLCAGAAPALAMQTPDIGLPVPGQPSATAPGKPAAGGKPDGTSIKFWFQTDVAPEIVSQDPFSADSTTSDATDVKWTLGMSFVLSRHWDIEATAGPVATVDSDGNSTASSRLAGSLRIRTADPILSSREGAIPQWSVRPFVKYALALRYTDFFEDRDGTEHTFDAGLALQVKFPGADLKIDVLPRRLESTLAGGDFTAFRLNPRLTVPLVENAIDLSLIGDAERRWYDHVDPSIGRARRDWRLQLFAGLNFANAINDYLNLSIVQDFSVGARLIEIDSNVGSQDRSTIKFAASVAVRVPLH